ncbi:uncharacterized protein T551_03068 [Pneumocystis jirovecii RU7]|uniref:Uncharacterized protein n=1 Tax=Pneumocystis jirovecii (strain RU7) TaxID=1408657 RepID=A0A0W4ZGR8_PNEJ7|nr:uncharacterized protein T551_03068 [Pneumocystis jirovecii RU7]KTW27569.1 hypothetical protein T551_03068 [Pneumocystis jirovecii RU7]
MTDLSSKQTQNASLSDTKTHLLGSTVDDSHIHRQTKAHKTFVVHGRHHTRVPSCGRNLNKMSKHAMPVASTVLVVPEDLKIRGISTNTFRKHVLQMDIDDTNKKTVQETEKQKEDTEDNEEKQNEQSGEIRLQVLPQNLEESEKSVIPCSNIKIHSFEQKEDLNSIKRIVSSISKPITSRLMSIRNHQVAMPYLTRETAIAENTVATQPTFPKENDSSYALQCLNETNNASTESMIPTSKVNTLKSTVSEPSFKSYMNRTQQKLLLQRELSLTCIKSHSKNEPESDNFIQRRIDYINKEYTNISRFINPSKHVILKLFHDGCLEDIKQMSNPINHKSSEDKPNKSSSKLADFIGKYDNHSKESDKEENEHNDITESIQIILEKMWTNNENVA